MAPSQCMWLDYHFDAPGRFEIFDPDMWYHVQSAGAQQFVCLSGLWVDAEVYFAETLQPGNYIGMPMHKAQISKEWLPYFLANMPMGYGGCWAATGRQLASPRDVIAPTFWTKAHSKKDLQQGLQAPIRDSARPVLWWNTDFLPVAGHKGLLIYVAPMRHGQKQHMLEQLKAAWHVLPMLRGVPGTREAWQAGHPF